METYMEKMGRLIDEYNDAVRVQLKMNARAKTAKKEAVEAIRRTNNAAVAVEEHRKSIKDYEKW